MANALRTKFATRREETLDALHQTRFHAPLDYVVGVVLIAARLTTVQRGALGYRRDRTGTTPTTTG